MPAAGVRATAPPFAALTDVLHDKQYWRVSAMAYIRRLYQLDLVTEWQYRLLVIEAS